MVRQPQPSPVAGVEYPVARTIYEEVQRRVQPVIQICKDGTKECVMIILGFVQAVVSTVGSLFQLSGKDDGPHAEL